ncbi:hypothetical protein [Enterobacter cloacae]|uniref:Zinc-ribbon domain-containing protein n=1 Tax=Enterobacter cloacae TaxID=550 RepID=A0AA42U6R9_ENTCL|nr:hypothetical protein [Enterobacter cloacae]MDH0438107.1 zinc-ribbon domain-containing protein [Enterobacter cloacae]MDH1481341.1 zinc-ribbon domain-containing protein [Enterobacter cloacae]
MITLTKEWLMKTIAELEEERDATPGAVNEDAAMALAAMKLALASLEAEPVGEVSEQRDGLVMDGTVDLGGASTHRIIKGASKMKRLPLGTKFYTAPPAPVSVPAAMEMDDDFDSAFEHGKAVGWNAYRAAMLQGADGTLTNEGTIPVTQFKPVADLYGLTSPTGGETSFTFDAVEARDFIDGGWSCQEYVELGRFQEAMLQGAEPVTTTTGYKLRDAVDAIRNSGIAIDAEKILAERDALNAPDCWCHTCRPVTISDMRFVVCPDCGNKRCPHANDHRNACTGSNEPGQEGSSYPAAPQQEA